MNTDSNSIKSQFIGNKNQGKTYTTPAYPLPVYFIKLASLPN